MMLNVIIIMFILHFRLNFRVITYFDIFVLDWLVVFWTGHHGLYQFTMCFTEGALEFCDFLPLKQSIEFLDDFWMISVSNFVFLCSPSSQDQRTAPHSPIFMPPKYRWWSQKGSEHWPNKTLSRWALVGLPPSKNLPGWCSAFFVW